MKDRNSRGSHAAKADRAHHDWWQWLAALAPPRCGFDAGMPDAVTAGADGTRARRQGSG